MARQSLKKKISIFFSGTGNTMTGCTNSFLEKPKCRPGISSPWKNNYKKLAIWEGHGPKTTLNPPKCLKKRVFYLEFFCGRSLAHVTLGPKNLSQSHPSLPKNVFCDAITTSGSEIRRVKVGRFSLFRPLQRPLAERYRNAVEVVDLTSSPSSNLPSLKRIVHGEVRFPHLSASHTDEISILATTSTKAKLLT